MKNKTAPLPFSRLSLDDEQYVKIALGELVYWRTTTLLYAFMGAFCVLVTALLAWQLLRNTERPLHLPLVCLAVMAAFSGGVLRAFIVRPERRRLIELMIAHYERAEALQNDIKAMRANPMQTPDEAQR